MDADELLQEIRFYAEIVARGSYSERKNCHATVRRLLENLDQMNNEAGWNRPLVAEQIGIVRERVASLAAIQGSQTWELDQHWAWTATAIDSVQDSMRSTTNS